MLRFGEIFLKKYQTPEIYHNISHALTSDLKIKTNKLFPVFFTEILTGKVVLWCFFSRSEKIHNSTFQVKISVKNVIFSNEMDKKPRYSTYLIFHRIWKKYFYSNSFLRNTLMIDMIGGQPTG